MSSPSVFFVIIVCYFSTFLVHLIDQETKPALPPELTSHGSSTADIHLSADRPYQELIHSIDTTSSIGKPGSSTNP
jgi:tetrahydromethanopterin S-methyltransferase subunit E